MRNFTEQLARAAIITVLSVASPAEAFDGKTEATRHATIDRINACMKMRFMEFSYSEKGAYIYGWPSDQQKGRDGIPVFTGGVRVVNFTSANPTERIREVFVDLNPADGIIDSFNADHTTEYISVEDERDVKSALNEEFSEYKSCFGKSKISESDRKKLAHHDKNNIMSDCTCDSTSPKTRQSKRSHKSMSKMKQECRGELVTKIKAQHRYDKFLRIILVQCDRFQAKLMKISHPYRKQ